MRALHAGHRLPNAARPGFAGLVLALAIAALAPGCKAKDQAPEETKTKLVAPLVDVTTATSLTAVRTVFNAHKGEARFLTLLSPT